MKTIFPRTQGARTRPFGLVLAVGALVGATGAEAQEAPQAAPETIVVSASRGTRLDDTDISTTVMTREQVDQAPEQGVDQIINKIPGVVISQVPSNQIHPTGKSIQMRGFGGGGERVLVMVDGIPINDPYYRYINWDKIPKDTVERIEVIRGGGATTLWGDMAMAGVINIVTREPQPGEARLSAGYGSLNTVRGNMRVTAYADNLLKIGLTAAHAQTDGYNLTPKQYRDQFTVPTASTSDDAELSAFLTPSSDAKYYFKAGIHRIEEAGLVAALAKNVQDSYELKAGGKFELTDGSAIDVDGWFSRYLMRTQNASLSGYGWASPGSATGTYVNTLDRNPYYDYGGSAVWKKDLGRTITDAMVGVDGHAIWGKDAGQQYTSSGANNYQAPSHGQQHFQGIFAQASYRADWAPAEVTLGLREDFWQADGAESRGIPLAAYGTFNHFDPRLGAKYYVTDQVALRSAVYENFSAPGMNQLFRSYGSGTSLSLANGALVPETNLGREVGIEYKRDDAGLAFNLFQNNLTNFIDKPTLCSSAGACASFIPAGSTFSSASQNLNAGNAVMKGWEVLGNWQVTREFGVNAGFTRNIAYLASNKTLAGKVGQAKADQYDPLYSQLGGVPPIMFTGGITWEPTPGLQLAAQVKSWQSMPDTTQHYTTDSSGTVVDLGADYKMNEHFDVFASVQNLFDNKYNVTGPNPTSSGTPPTAGPPLQVFGGIKMAY